MNAGTSIADAMNPSPSTNSILPSHSFTRGAVSAWDLCGLVGCVGAWRSTTHNDGPSYSDVTFRWVLSYRHSKKKNAPNAWEEEAGYPPTVHEFVMSSNLLPQATCKSSIANSRQAHQDMPSAQATRRHERQRALAPFLTFLRGDKPCAATKFHQ